VSNSPTLRFATPQDADELAPLNYQLIRDEGHRNPMTVEQLADRMRAWLQADYRALLYLHQDHIIAYALYRETADEIYLRHLFVGRDHRRCGIGRMIMNHLKQQVWSADKRLTVEVLARNEPALLFWRAMGYKDYAIALEILPSDR
jgi:GNAT superfamily N-acetyltransferase